MTTHPAAGETQPRQQFPEAQDSGNMFELEHLQLLALSGYNRQPLFRAETGLPPPKAHTLGVVHLTPGVGRGLQACCQGLSGQRA